jgi:DUF971 family protein
MRPKKISVKENKYLNIIWLDDSECSILLSDLRKNCPCAECLTDRHHRPANYIPLFSSVSLTLSKVEPVGNYAIRLFWQDGHYSGIYSFNTLKNFN